MSITSRNMAERMLSPFLSFQELRHAFVITCLSVVPSIAMFVILQVYLTDLAVAVMCQGHPLKVDDLGFAPLFNYYAIWVAHVLLAIGVAFVSERAAFRNASEAKNRVLKRFRAAVFLLLMLIVFAADATHRKIAVLSHERIFAVLSRAQPLASMFQNQVQIFGRSVPAPTLFSILPMVAVGAALWAMATVILCCSKFLAEFQRPKDIAAGDSDSRVVAFGDAMEALRAHFLALSLVLLTSTLATIAFFRTPIGLLKPSERAAFQAISDAMGLVWGVTFSLTLVALCVYPFIVLRRQLENLERDAQDTQNETLGKWVRKYRTLLQVPANLKLIISMLSPATVAVLSRLISA